MPKYIDYINLSSLPEAKGASDEEIALLEKKLAKPIPLSLKEYLSLLGKNKPLLFFEWEYHGVDDMAEIHDLLYEWIDEYKSKGLNMDALANVIPFFKFQDTFFYIPGNEGDNPPVYAFDIGDTPDITELSPSFSDFIRESYRGLFTRGR